MQRPRLLLLLWSTLCSIACTVAQNVTIDDDGSFPYDPILQYRPNFARSLPVQILITGVVFSLVSVLLIHLVFTGQYHLPMGPINYILQISSVSTLLISLIATLVVVLRCAADNSQHWPYMLNYIAVDVPPVPGTNDTQWTTLETVGWYVLDATTSGLVQITHVQFLTFLYPSSLEGKLIFGLLGPLAVLAALFDLLLILSPSRLATTAEAARNICTAALSVLFTTSLFIWGFLVNRKQAWRTDGGTAAFGSSALLLALFSTAISLVYIPSKDQYVWMRQLMFAVTLWQSFLGWWWWVGAGMGVGEVEELLKREEKRNAKRKMRLAKRELRKERAQIFWRGVVGGLKSNKPALDAQSRNMSEASSLNDISSGASGVSPGAATGLPASPAVSLWLKRWWALLRHAHLTAAREQAIERVEIRQQVYGPDSRANRREAARVPGVAGWALGSFALAQAGNVSDGKGDSDEDGYELEGGVSAEEGAGLELAGNGGEGVAKATGREESSMWWWGPLRRWRLQDSTVY